MKKKFKKKYFVMVLVLILSFCLMACQNNCEHVYDDCADLECNECDETRISDHSWIEADCDTAKTCSICGKIEGEPLEHKAVEDDGDCTTAVKCSNCEVVLVAAKEHNFSGEWQNDLTQHWLICQNDGCDAINEKTDHNPQINDNDCTTSLKCDECEYILVENKESHLDNNLDGICDFCVYEFDYVYDETTMTYIVFTAEGLYAWKNDSWKGLNLKLAKDIVMPSEMKFDIDEDGVNDSNWESTRTGNIIDGNGYSIIGLVMKSTIIKDMNGFINTLDEGGVIKNLRLENADISFSGINHGILVGYNNGTIENCSVSGKIYVDGNNVGGITGTNSGNIVGCFNEADITTTLGVTGGIVGQNSIDSSIIACYNTGSIVSDTLVGGIVGALYYGQIVACYNTGKINGENSVGIICGYLDSNLYIDSLYASYHNENSSNIVSDHSIIVDNDIITWDNAKEEMNKALANIECVLRYVKNDNSVNCPLTLFK